MIYPIFDHIGLDIVKVDISNYISQKMLQILNVAVKDGKKL